MSLGDHEAEAVGGGDFVFVEDGEAVELEETAAAGGRIRGRVVIAPFAVGVGDGWERALLIYIAHSGLFKAFLVHKS